CLLCRRALLFLWLSLYHLLHLVLMLCHLRTWLLALFQPYLRILFPLGLILLALLPWVLLLCYIGYMTWGPLVLSLCLLGSCCSCDRLLLLVFLLIHIFFLFFLLFLLGF